MTSLLVKREKSSSPARSILGKRKIKTEPVDQKVSLNVASIVETVSERQDRNVETASEGQDRDRNVGTVSEGQDQNAVTETLDMIGSDLNNNCPSFESEQEIDEAIMSMVTPVITIGNDLTSDQEKNEPVPRRLSFEDTKDESEREEEDVVGDEESNECNQTRIGLFSREIAQMMYGAGDEVPFVESINLLNDLVIDYMTEVTCKAMTTGKSGQIDIQDVLYLTRKESEKHSRIKSLIEINEDLKAARRAFDVDTIAGSSISDSTHFSSAKKRKGGE